MLSECHIGFWGVFFHVNAVQKAIAGCQQFTWGRTGLIIVVYVLVHLSIVFASPSNLNLSGGSCRQPGASIPFI